MMGGLGGYGCVWLNGVVLPCLERNTWRNYGFGKYFLECLGNNKACKEIPTSYYSPIIVPSI